MKKLKVATIIGTRPDIIKLSEIIKKADEYFEHILIHTGQNYDYTLNEVFFNDLGLRSPGIYLNVAGGNLGEVIGAVISKSYDTLSEVMPDALLVLGDTNSSLCTISAKRLKIPIFHLEAGNRCFDENLPEEINRRIVDHISDINLPYTEHARRYLLSEGIRKEHIFVVGSPMTEVITANFERIESSRALEILDLSAEEYIVLSAHREENIDNEKTFLSLMNSVNSIAESYGLPVVYSVHPRSAMFISERGFKFHPLVRQLEPFGFTDYVRLQIKAFCVVSDSGTLAEESAILKFPAVSIRTSTERPEALEKGGFVLGGIDEKSIIQSIDMAVKMAELGYKTDEVPDYVSDNVSSKVVKLIQSYTDVVNKRVWGKV